MKNILQSITVLSAALLIFGCSTGGDDNGGGSTPGTSTLAFPLNNSECLSGTSVSETESKITFEWNASTNTETYFVYVKNLNTQQSFQYNAGSATMLDITLLKGIPYSWNVGSKSANGTITASEKWKFYNAGNGIVNYAPFPADAISPIMSSTISGTTVNLQWETSDIDSDIVDYKVYMDTNPNPTTLITTVTSKNANNIPITANTTYYWKIVTTDSASNTSTSDIFQFKTS